MQEIPRELGLGPITEQLVCPQAEQGSTGPLTRFHVKFVFRQKANIMKQLSINIGYAIAAQSGRLGPNLPERKITSPQTDHAIHFNSIPPIESEIVNRGRN
jgi:hypothetical protein